MTKKKPKSKRTLVKGPRTKELIKSAVLDLSLRKNWDAIMIDDICATTGLTVGAFYHHFSSKDEVIAQISTEFLASRYADVVDQINPNSGLFETYSTVIRRLYSSFLRDPTLCRLTGVVARNRPATYDQWLELSAPLTDKLVGAIRLAKERKGPSRPSEEFIVIWLLTSLDDYFSQTYRLATKKGTGSNALCSDQENFIRDLATLWYRASTACDP